ncbi:MAG: peptidoglycan DD-metalloendopeptidase family protein [Xanthomonadales bacterium]|nr:peptidoglycan DD-metalloendopeptidase family protein [Xanthomonadales bacterium]NIX12352.1 peptidoglycan DD-metalloendopeptidase family protein [Xanthomonadales bacterium]
MNRDYKFLAQRPRRIQRRLPAAHHHLLLLVVAAVVMGAVLSAAPDDAAATRDGLSASVLRLPPAFNPTATITEELNLPRAAGRRAEVAGDPPEGGHGDGTWREITVHPGDSLALIFTRQGLGPRQVFEVMQAGKPAVGLKRLHPGETLRLRLDEHGQLQELVHQRDESRGLRVLYDGEGYRAEPIARELELRLAHAGATIDLSLFLAAQQAGLSDNLTMELAAIFGWDIDFALDIRRGDQFTVLYEELYLDGRKVRDGGIVAAEFINRGKSYRAIRYTDAAGHTDYYTPEGLSMRKAFLRTPVKFSRISSRFTRGRRHPILNRIRAHKGVDYAAPRGTPVRATGDGKVIHRGRKGGYGRTVVIKHGTRYSTLYAHLSGYHRRARSGRRVSQGQVIGYIGASGLATGPHLHYEFRINGVHRNPLTVKLPEAKPIKKRYRQDFLEASASRVAQLDLLRRTLLARN